MNNTFFEFMIVLTWMSGIIRFRYYKPIRTLVMCITNESIIRGLRSNRDLFRRWHCKFCKEPHTLWYLNESTLLSKVYMVFSSYLIRYFVEDIVCGDQCSPPPRIPHRVGLDHTLSTLHSSFISEFDSFFPKLRFILVNRKHVDNVA